MRRLKFIALVSQDSHNASKAERHSRLRQQVIPEQESEYALSGS